MVALDGLISLEYVKSTFQAWESLIYLLLVPATLALGGLLLELYLKLHYALFTDTTPTTNNYRVLRAVLFVDGVPCHWPASSAVKNDDADADGGTAMVYMEQKTQTKEAAASGGDKSGKGGPSSAATSKASSPFVWSSLHDELVNKDNKAVCVLLSGVEIGLGLTLWGALSDQNQENHADNLYGSIVWLLIGIVFLCFFYMVTDKLTLRSLRLTEECVVHQNVSAALVAASNCVSSGIVAMYTIGGGVDRWDEAVASAFLYFALCRLVLSAYYQISAWVLFRRYRHASFTTSSAIPASSSSDNANSGSGEKVTLQSSVALRRNPAAGLLLALTSIAVTIFVTIPLRSSEEVAAFILWAVLAGVVMFLADWLVHWAVINATCASEEFSEHRWGAVCVQGCITISLAVSLIAFLPNTCAYTLQLTKTFVQRLAATDTTTAILSWNNAFFAAVCVGVLTSAKFLFTLPQIYARPVDEWWPSLQYFLATPTQLKSLGGGGGEGSGDNCSGTPRGRDTDKPSTAFGSLHNMRAHNSNGNHRAAVNNNSIYNSLTAPADHPDANGDDSQHKSRRGLKSSRWRAVINAASAIDAMQKGKKGGEDGTIQSVAIIQKLKRKAAEAAEATGSKGVIILDESSSGGYSYTPSADFVANTSSSASAGTLEAEAAKATAEAAKTAGSGESNLFSSSSSEDDDLLPQHNNKGSKGKDQPPPLQQREREDEGNNTTNPTSAAVVGELSEPLLAAEASLDFSAMGDPTVSPSGAFHLGVRVSESRALAFSGLVLALGQLLRACIGVSTGSVESPVTSALYALLWIVISLVLLLIGYICQSVLLWGAWRPPSRVNTASGIIHLSLLVAVALQAGNTLLANQQPGPFDFPTEISEALIFYTLQMALVACSGLIYQRLTPHDDRKAVLAGNAAAAVANGCALVASALLVSAPATKTDELLLFVVYFIITMTASHLTRHVVVRVVLFKGRSTDLEVMEDKNWGAALVEGAVMLAAAFAYTGLLREKCPAVAAAVIAISSLGNGTTTTPPTTPTPT